MEYIMIGFYFAIGCYFGEATLNVITKTLIKWIERSEWYQEVVGRRSEFIEQTDDIRVVKNQIGFR